nr:MAG TPA: hypothetical protein [Caudoviricetes sp.]
MTNEEKLIDYIDVTDSISIKSNGPMLLIGGRGNIDGEIAQCELDISFDFKEMTRNEHKSTRCFKGTAT